jgi:ribosomal protein L21
VHMERELEQEEYQQLLFAGFEQEKQEEVIVENAVVESEPIWEKHGKSYEWGCSVYCPPDIFNQDRSDYYEVHAKAYALEAKKKRLRPGDVVTLRGVRFTQEIETAKEGRKTVNHFVVSAIDVISRAKRRSITVYEQKRKQ